MALIIPHTQLRPETLQSLLEEYVTREGTFYGHRDITLHEMTEIVRRQLGAGTAVVVYDENSQSCTIIPRENFKAEALENPPVAEPPLENSPTEDIPEEYL